MGVASALANMPRAVAESGIRCVIVDDHRMVLDLLEAEVGDVPGVSVAATATDVSAARRLAALERVDLLIVDRKLGTGDGMEVVRAVASRHPGVRCVVIAGTTADFVCPPDLLPFVMAVIDKKEARDVLLEEIGRVVGTASGPGTVQLATEGIRSRLTGRQWELFVALGGGLSSKELARTFGIAPRTVETHRKAIARKLGVSGAALVRLAVLHCLVQRRSA